MDKYCIFWSGLGCHRKIITICRHDCGLKYMIVTRDLTREILKILKLSEILPFYLVDTLYLSVVVTCWRQILLIWLGSEVVEN